MSNKDPVDKDAPARDLSLRKKLAFSLATVVALFVCAEVLLRFARIGEPPVIGSLRFGYDTGIPIFDSDGIQREGEPYQDVPLFAADPALFWKPIADTPFTGSDGLRRKTPANKAKPAGVYRIGVLGDSCSFLGIELYPDRFAKNVNEGGDAKVEIVNASCPGYTSFQGTRRLADLWPWQVDAVIVYFGWNDHWKSLNGQTDRDVMQQQLLSNKAQSWLGKSRLFWFVYSLRAKIAPPVSVSRAPVRVPPEHYADNLRTILDEIESHDCKAIFVTAPSAFIDGDLPPWVYNFFGQIYQMPREQVAAIPRTHAQYNDVVRQTAEQSPNAYLLDIARQWSAVEMLPKHSEFFRGDRIHLTEGGHEEIARQLVQLWNEKLKPSGD